jgi:hypothetical protein
MKPIPIIFLFVLFILNSPGQSFLSEGKQWNVKETLNFGPTTTVAYQLIGDSAVGNYTYKKLAVYDSTYQAWSLTGLLREAENRVYFKPEGQEEGLLYDFTLQNGETVNIISLYCPDEQELTVTNVDTIENLGIERKRWSFNQSITEVWLEGIGSLYGPVHTFYDHCIFDLYFDLLCTYEADTVSYDNPDYESCWLTSVGMGEKIKDNTITIYPNPVSAARSVGISSEKVIRKLEILSGQGMQIKTIDNLNRKNIRIDLSGMASGLYFIMIRYDNQEITSGKIMVR